MTKHVHTVQLRWGDYDPLQHVNNVKYFEFMQDARVGLIESVGGSRETLSKVGHVVAHNEIDYVLPIGLDVTEVSVEIWVTDIGGASYKLAYEFRDAAGTLYAKAKTVMVTMDMTTNTVIRIPQELREVMSAYGV